MFNPNKIGNSITALRGGATVGANGPFQCADTTNGFDSGRLQVGMLGADITPAQPPFGPAVGAPTTDFPLQTGDALSGVTLGTPASWVLTFTPKNPIRVLAIYIDPVQTADEVQVEALYTGLQAYQLKDNLLAMNGPTAGAIPGRAFTDLNACVPLFKLDAVASYTCPFILVGRTLATQTSLNLAACLVVAAA